MKTLLSLLLTGLLVGSSIYLFLEKPAPKKYLELVTKEEPLRQNNSVNILFVGDIMLDRGIRKVINENGFGYILNDVKDMFQNHDLIIGNLEGTITENQSIAIKNNQILRFTFSTTTARELKKAGFSGFSLANNHTLDFYQAGYDETRKNLSEAGLFSFGSPLNNQKISHEILIKNKKLCYIGYHSLYSSTTTSVIKEINTLKGQCDFIVVMSHWGEEYEDFENEHQRAQAHSFIDAGADLIIGHHPHVIQPIEIYKNKAIFYSLGNFIFDQDFSLKTRRGIGVDLIVGEKTLTFKIIPIEMYKGKLYFSNLNDFSEQINILISKLSNSEKASILENLTIELLK